MAYFKLKATGTRPYSVTARNFSNNTVHTASVINSDEIEIPDAVMNSLVGGIDVQVSDSVGQSASIRYDNATLGIMKQYQIGYCVTNGSPTDHIDGINRSEVNNLTYTTVMFDSDDMLTDAAMTAIENAAPFDHTQPISGTPACRYDAVVRHAYTRTKAKRLRVMVWAIRDRQKLDDITGNTLYYRYQDAAMRQNGSTPITRTASDNNSSIVISYAASRAITFAKRLTLMFAKRYAAAINDGTIMGLGLAVSKQAEGEQSYQYTYNGDWENGESGYEGTQGDFHPEMISKFKTRFPQHNLKSVNEIATSSQTSDLQRDWTWFLGDIIRILEWECIDNIVSNVNITRTKFWVADSGSFVDALTPRRKTYNILERAKHPKVFIVKSNDGPYDNVDYFLDHISSVARAIGGIAIVEPTPPGDVSLPEHLGVVRSELNKAWDRGIHLSIFGRSASQIAELMLGVYAVPGAIPKPKSEFITSGGNKIVTTHLINLSDVIKDGAMSGNNKWRNDWQTFKNNNPNVTHVNTLSVDNVKPS